MQRQALTIRSAIALLVAVAGFVWIPSAGAVRTVENLHGWRYRTRRLKRDLMLVANGRATIIQDELQNAYQRLPGRRGSSGAEHR